MRFITNHKLTDHIKIETLRETTKLIPIMAVIKSRTLKLFGHIKRSHVGYSKPCLEGMVTVKDREVPNIHAGEITSINGQI